ncbi:MAG: Brp/Blh family beta-carotene 15,15'-dioxygenase [Nonlabens sp.]|uniref:Brp/Blh family beta-carotene 15,15'-dioxygenase n=2 Tax=Nonlabens sp. TaxID=1888209 RepID=UPI003219D4BF
MSKKTHLYNLIMVISFFALWVSIQIPESMEFILGYFLILTIGVGHGANDLKVYFNRKTFSIRKKITFLSIYSLTVLIGFGLFFIIPEFILTVFIIISGYHFGQEHFEKYEVKNTWYYKIFIGSYGIIIILTLLTIHLEESMLIINDLLNSELVGEVLLYPLIIVVATMLLSFLKFARLFSWKEILKECFYLLLIYTLFSASSLVWGFAIYFILWHSIPSIYSQISYLQGAVNKKSIKKYILDSLLYWIAALVFLAVLYYFLSDYTNLFLSTIIAFLGGITFPHVFVMNKLNNK